MAVTSASMTWNVNAVLTEFPTQSRGLGSEQSDQTAQEILGRTDSLGLQIGRHLLGTLGSENGPYIRGSRANFGRFARRFGLNS